MLHSWMNNQRHIKQAHSLQYTENRPENNGKESMQSLANLANTLLFSSNKVLIGWSLSSREHASVYI